MTTTKTVLAWHSDPDLKARIVARMHQHRAADAIVRGFYQVADVGLPLGYRGCALGCLLDWRPSGAAPDDGWRVEVQRQFGIHWEIADSIDNVFEDHDDNADASDFAVAVAEAIPVGADLTEVAKWCRDECICLEREAAELLERLRSAPVPARADR